MTTYKDKQKKIEKAYTLEEYLMFPKDDLHYLKWFYITPRYQSFNSVEDFFKDGKFETAFDKHFKKNYPIQFFFRETLTDFFRYKLRAPISRKYYKINEWLFPRQKWLIKKIPNHWTDKDYLIMMVIFESVIHYVEEEKAFKYIDWDHDEQHRKEKAIIEKIYRWAKLRKQVEHRLENYKTPLFGLYQKILDDYDRHFAIETVKISDRMWV